MSLQKRILQAQSKANALRFKKMIDQDEEKNRSSYPLGGCIEDYDVYRDSQ